MLVELQDVFHQLFLCLVDVEYGDAGELELVAVSRQHDGFPLSGEEESVVLHINLCRDEVVGIHVRGVICQFAEAMERADDCMGIILSRIVFSPRLVRVFASTIAISGW